MKKTLLPFSIFFPIVIGILFSIFNSHAQGTILSFSTLPATPTANDAVKVVASLSFTSGDCELSEQGHTTNLAHTTAYAHHCLGMLTVICYATDTFELGTLPAGDHTFVLSLSSGGGPPPCTPGIVIDDTDSITFTVDPGVGIHSPDAVDFSVYPNPASSSIVIDCGMRILNCELKITNAIGQLVHQSAIQNPQSAIDVSSLSPGLYYLTLQSAEGVGVKKFEVIR
jgi:hypothetical protein